MLRGIALALSVVLYGLESLAFYMLLVTGVLEVLTAPFPCTKQPDCASWRSLANVSQTGVWLLLAGLGIYLLTALLLTSLADLDASEATQLFFQLVTLVPLLTIAMFFLIVFLFGVAIVLFILLFNLLSPLASRYGWIGNIEGGLLFIGVIVNGGLSIALYNRLKESTFFGPVIEKLLVVRAWIFWWYRPK